MKVLLIDNSPIFIEIFELSIKLNFPNVELTTLNPITQGYSTIRTEFYDVVFLDWFLGPYNGEYLFPLIRAAQTYLISFDPFVYDLKNFAYYSDLEIINKNSFEEKLKEILKPGREMAMI